MTLALYEQSSLQKVWKYKGVGITEAERDEQIKNLKQKEIRKSRTKMTP